MHRTKKVATILILLLIIVYVLLASDHFQWGTDGGIPIEGARRILSGEVLYRDFFEFWMPGTFYFLALLIQLLGFSFGLIRTIAFVNISAICALTFLIARKLNLSTLLSLLSTLLFLLPSAVFCYNHNWLGLLFICLGCWVLLWPPKSWTKWIIMGLINGVAISFNQWQGAAMFVAVSLTVLKIGAAPVSGPPLCPVWNLNLKEFKKFVIYALSTTLIPLFWCLYFWQQSTLRELLYATIIFPLTHYPTGNMHQIPSNLWWLTTIFYLVFFWRERYSEKGKEDKEVLRKLRVISIFGFIAHVLAIVSPNTGHTALSYPFTAPLVVCFTKHKISQFRKQSIPNLSSVTSLLTSSIFIKQAVRKALFLLFICLFATVSFFHFASKINYFLFKEAETLQTNYGDLKTTARVKTVISQMQDCLAESADRKEYIYIAPWFPSLYTILDTSNPTRHAHLGFEHYTQEIINGVISDLKEKSVETIIFLPSLSYAYERQPEYFSQFLENNFELSCQFELGELENRTYPRDGVWTKIAR
ncbi:hypothetical protein KKB83_01655 [Patescibacteria group bacterium]|nr:hypothetical protein [Patescibacteria group bacterium]